MSILFFKFGKNPKGKLYLCGNDLVNKSDGSFRIGKDALSDKLFILRILKSVYYKLFKAPKLNYSKTGKSKTALYDQVLTSNNSKRLEYATSMTGEIPGYYISKEEILQYPMSLIFKSLLLFFSTVYALFVLIPSVFSKNRAMYSFSIIEFAECASLVYILKLKKISHVYYSFIFEKDSNICSYILNKFNIKVTKNPSEDPLYFNNQFIIADTLAICNAYQKEELSVYSETLFIQDTIDWIPEQGLDYIPKYGNGNFITPKNTIGFYSGSSWYRIAYGYNLVKGDYNPYSAEFELIDNLKSYLLENIDCELIIFMHPVEKKEGIYEKSVEYYKEKFSGVNYKLAARNESTMFSLEKVDVAVTVFSGSVTYRLYAGFKGIFYPANMKNYPIKGSTLDLISANNKEELFSLLNRTLKMETSDFFKTFKLENYSYRNFLNKYKI